MFTGKNNQRMLFLRYELQTSVCLDARRDKRQIGKGIVYEKPAGLISRPEDRETPHWIIAVIPMVVTIVGYNAFKLNILVCLGMNIVLCLILFWKYFGKLEGLKKLLEPAPKQFAELLLQVGALGTMGAVVAASPVFPVITNGLLNMNVPGLYKVVLCIAVLAGASGSEPAGLNASLPYLSETFAQMGISMNALHRVAAFSSQTLDTLPTNPGYIIATGICECPIRTTYKYVFITTVVNTLIGSLVVATILTIFPGLA